MKRRKSFSLLIIPVLLSGCSHTPDSSTKNEGFISEPDENSNINSKDQNKDNKGDVIKDSSEGEDDPYTFDTDSSETLGYIGTEFHCPSPIPIDSSLSLDIYVGHIWKGTYDFSKYDSAYLSLTYKLIMIFDKGPLNSSILDNNDYKYIEIADLSDFNTSDYDIDVDGRKNTHTYLKSVHTLLSKDIFDISENEMGYFTFEVFAYKEPVNDLKSWINLDANTFARDELYFVIKNDKIIFDSFYRNFIPGYNES